VIEYNQIFTCVGVVSVSDTAYVNATYKVFFLSSFTASYSICEAYVISQYKIKKTFNTILEVTFTNNVYLFGAGEYKEL
jgi:hypothetical protein